MRVLVAGGGTAGHVNPAIAIAKYMRDHDHAQVLFIGTKKGLESNLVPAEGFEIRYIEVEGFKRSLTLENIKVVLKTLGAIGECKRIIKEFKPDVTICTGGYVSGAVMHASHAMKVPCMIHEQNVYPGVTVKLSVRYADVILTSFQETKNHLSKPEKCLLVGNPVRSEILKADRNWARKVLELDERPFILAFGGSLGAQKLNDAVIDYIGQLNQAAKVQILFGTGARNYDAVMAQLAEKKIAVGKQNGVWVVPYIHNMHEAMAAADMVISRAGAITISEICALGKPSILIPSPNVAHNHQEQNARTLEKNHAAMVILEQDLNGNALQSKVEILLKTPATIRAMSDHARAMGVADATQKICEKACEIARK